MKSKVVTQKSYMLVIRSLSNKSSKSYELLIRGYRMFRTSKRFFSCKIMLSSSVPSRREGLDVIQLCAAMIGLPVSLFRRRLFKRWIALSTG